MGGLLRKLCIYICAAIYPFIVKVYAIFYNLANTRFLEGTDVINKLSANIYVLVSVVMLFAFSVTILSAIVNPDLLTDGKKGVAAAFKRAIIGLALMILIPFMFNELYALQKNVMTNSLIEKIIVGVDFSCKDNDPDCEVGGNGGQVIAGTLISSVLYPDENFADKNGNINVNADVADSYTKMVTENIDYIGAVKKDINAVVDGTGGSDGDALKASYDDDAYAFHFDGLLAMVVGGATIYILVLFCIDVAVRVFKLAFLELTAPISIVGYMAAGDKILSSWFKEVGKTFADLFIRIAALAFYLFLISNISSLFDNLGSKSGSFAYKAFFKAFLVVGMLIFAKQVPDIIGNLFGIKLESKGGIGGRLGSMAAVGKQAQKAWGAVKNAAGIAAGVGALGAVGAGIGIPGALGVAGAAFGGKKLWDKKLKNTKFGSAAQRVAGGIGTIGRGVGAAGKTLGAFAGGKGTFDALKSARNTWNETEFGTDMKYKKGKKEDARFNEKIGLDSNGRVRKSEKTGTEFVPDQRRIIQDTEANVTRNMKKDVGNNNAKIIENLHANSKEKSTIESVSAKSKDVIDKLESMKLSALTTTGKQQLEALQNDFSSGDISATELRNRLQDLYSKGEVQASSVKKVSSDVDAIEGIISSSESTNIKSLMDSDGTLKMNKISGMTKEITENYDSAKKDYDDTYKGQTDSVKAEMDRYVGAYAAIDKSTIDVDKKSVNNTTSVDGNGQSFMDQIKATEVNIQPEATAQNTSSTSFSSNNSEQSLNLNLNETSSEPIKQDDYHISSSGGLHLNQQQVEEQRLDSERAKLDDDLERMTNDINKMNSNDDKPKFKLKDE